MTGFVLFAGILALLATAIIWGAVRAGRDAEGALAPGERRDAAIEALRQLEFEHDTDKISEEEYLAVRERLRAEALAARDEALVELPGTPAAGVAGGPVEGGDAQVVAGSEDGGTRDAAVTDCPGCGAELRAGERFCPSCGRTVG